MGTRFAVDPEALDSLADRLECLRAGVEELADVPGGHADIVGSAAVAEALTGVARNWGNARRQLTGRLGEAAAYAGAAARAYTAVDESVAGRFGPS